MGKFNNLRNIYNNYIVFICFIICIYIFYLLFAFTGSGLDLTDEGYYINWISNPFIYKSSISQFGFFYNPIFILIDENLSNLRKVNITFYFLLSYLLIYFLCKPLLKLIKVNFFYYQIFLISFSSFIFLSINHFTPSYNSLTLQGLLITVIGILILENYEKKKIGCFLIGLGGWIVFMGKPSSAAFLAVVILIYFFTKKDSLHAIFLCSITSLILLLCSSLAIDGSPILFFKRILLEMELYLASDSYTAKGLSQSLTTIIANSELQNINKIYVTLLSLISIFIFIFIFFYLNINNTNFKYIFKIIFISLILLIFFYIHLNDVRFFLIFERYQRMQVFSIFLFSIFVILIFFKLNLKKIVQNLNIKIIILFLFLPYIYAFGSNVNILKKSLDASIFYLIASFIIMLPFFKKKKNHNKIFVFSLTGLFITLVHLNSIIEQPVRQINSLRSNNFSFKVDNKNNILKLSKIRGTYIKNAKNIATNAGLNKGDYILDLTGKSPGLIYLLNAKSLGSAWMIGGHGDISLEFTKQKLNLESCKQISNTWILHDKKSRNISPNVLHTYGLDINIDYQNVGSWKAEEYKGSWVQTLFKPKIPSEIFIKCKINKKIK